MSAHNAEIDAALSGVCGTFMFQCRWCGTTVHVVDTVRQWHDCALRSELSLVLRRAARKHLGLKVGDYWPSEIADAQADALLDAGCVIPPEVSTS